MLYDKYKNYQMAFHTVAVLAAVALLCGLAAKRPTVPEGGLWGRRCRRQPGFQKPLPGTAQEPAGAVYQRVFSETAYNPDWLP